MRAIDFENPPDEYFDRDEILVLLDMIEERKTFRSARTIAHVARCAAAEAIENRGYSRRRARKLAMFGIVPYRLAVDNFGAMFGGWEHRRFRGSIEIYTRLTSTVRSSERSLILKRPSTQTYARCAFCGFFLRLWEGGTMTPAGLFLITNHTAPCALQWRVRELR